MCYHFRNQCPRKVSYKNENPYILDQECPPECDSGRNFKNTIVIFEISTLKFVKNKFLTNKVSNLPSGQRRL